MGKGIENRTTRKLLLGSASALAIGFAFAQGAAAAPCGNGADVSISSACTGPFAWTSGNLTIAGAGTITGTSTTGIGIAGSSTVGTLTNSGSVTVTSGVAAALHNLGTLVSITNSGGIRGHIVGIDNGGSIGTITNAGTIKGHLQNQNGATIGALYNNLGAITDDIYNLGSMTLLRNDGLIDNGGLANEGAITTLTNDGTIRSIGSTAAITNSGAIGTLTNNGVITGPAVALANYSGSISLENNGLMSGQIGLWNTGSILLTNAGILAGDINNMGTLTISGGSGGTIGTLTGYNGSIGTITGSFNFGTGALRLNDVVNGVVTVVGIGGTLTNTGSIGGAYGQIAVSSGASLDLLRNDSTVAAASTSYSAIDNGGTIGTLLNLGEMSGRMGIISNHGVINQFTNSGSFTNTLINNVTSFVQTGSVGVLTNTGAIAVRNFLSNSGSIDTISNQGTMTASRDWVIKNNNVGSIISLENSGDITSAGTAISNTGSIDTITNSRLISGKIAISNSGSIGILDNSGLINTGTQSYSDAIANAGWIGQVANSGTIEAISSGSYGNAIANSGTIDLIDNQAGGLISGSAASYGDWPDGGNGIYTTKSIGQIFNEGRIQGFRGIFVDTAGSIDVITNGGTISAYGTNPAVVSYGRIGTITNTGNITGGVFAYGGTIDRLENLAGGTITGQIQGGDNSTPGGIGTLVNEGVIYGLIFSQHTLQIYGASGTLFGTLTSGNLSGEFQFAGGNLVLDDNGQGAHLSNTGATLQVNQTLTIGNSSNDATIGSFSQSSGTLQFGTGGGLVVSGAANFTGGTIVVGDATGNYSFGQTRTVIAADSSSSYTGATIKTGFLGLSFTKATTGGDLVLTYTNDYIGGTLASFAESRSISGGQYAIYIASTGNIGTLTNSSTLVGTTTALNNTGIIGELDNLAGATIGDNINATGLYNAGRIDTLVNVGTIRGNIAGLRNNGGTIGLIRNEGSLLSTGVAVFNTGSIGTIASTITNTSAIQGSIDNRGIIDLIDNSAGITGNGVAIYSAGTIGTIHNTGTIRNSYSGAGITLAGGTIGVLDNSGVIGDRGALAVTGGRLGMLTNTGTMASITLSGGTIVTLSNANSISGLQTGIDNSAGSIENLINAVGGTIFGNSAAIKNSSTIGTLSNSGFITGSTNALTNTGSISLINSGRIEGNINNTGTLTISGGSNGTIGTLTGYNGSIGTFSGTVLTFNTGALVLNDVIAGGVTVVGTGGSLTNTGTIGTVSGVNLGSLAALDSLTNSGEITAGTGAVLNYGLIGTVTNSGSLAGDAGIANGGTIAEIVNTGTGTILSTGGGAWAAGILNWGGSIGAIDNSGLISEAGLGEGIVNSGTISLLTNGGKIENLGGGAAIGNVLGSIVSLNNSGEIIGGGTIAGTAYAAIENADVIGVLTNSGSITALGGGPAVYNTGSITLITNTDNGLITGAVAIQNGAGIGSISNNGAIAGALTGVVNTGTIGTLSNSGMISGSVYAINTAGQITALKNSGTIGGNIVTTAELNVTGGSGTVFGLLSGGTITGNIKLSGGNTRFADDVTGRLAIEGGIVEIATHVSITGSLTQSGGILDLLSGGELLVAGDAHLSSGLIVVEGLSATGNYTAGDQMTLIAADDTSDYSGVSIQLSIPGVSATTTIANGDLIAIFGNDYIGGTLASTTLTGSMGGGDYGYFIGGTGNIGSLTNNGTLNGDEYAFYNGGTIGTFENNGQIVDGTGLANAGSIGVLTNNAVISGGNGLANFGIIDTLTNAASGVITGTTNAGIYNTGSIGQLTNSGTITGPVYAIDNSGSLGPITNSGTIAGNIRSTSTLSIAGGTGATYGVLSGGTITADVNFTAGNLRLSDAIVGQASNSGAQLQLASTLTITGTYSQTAGTLEVGSNILTVSGKATISGGTVTAALSSAANYLAGQGITLIDAAAGSSYAGATVSLTPITGLSAIATTASTEDLAITFGNDYVGGSLASLNNTGAISGAAYGVYVASSGTLSALANAGTIGGTQYAIYSAGSLGTITNTGLISGNIRSSGALAFAGTGGTLSGGTITATGVSIAGSLRLADAINVGSGTVNAGTASVALPSKITITGNYLQTGGVLSSDITDTTTYGALAVSGSATITNTTITVNGTSVRSGRTYTIVDAGAASSYTGDTINLVGAHYRAELSTVGDDLIASFKPLFGEIGAAKGGASAVMGGVLDQLSNNTALQPMIDRMSLLSDVDLGRALEQAAPIDVGGGVASLQRTSLIEDLIGRAVSSRRSAAAGWSVWQTVLGGSAQRSAVAGAAGYDTTAAGLVLGVDSRIREDLLIGAALSWSAGWNAGRGDVSGSANGVNGFALTGYGSWTDGALTVNGRVAIGLDHYKQHRTMTYFDDKAEADYSGQHYVIGADGSYDFTLAPGVTLSPQASLRWLRLAVDGYSETGVGALTVGSVIADQVQSSLGAKLAWAIDTRFGLVMPEIRAAWLHDFVDDPGEANAGLGGLSFTTTSARISANGIRVGTGLTFYQSDATSLRLEYDGDFRDDYTAHGGMLQLSLKL